MRNRTQRRAAERAALKALKRQQRQNPVESRPTTMHTNEVNTTNNSAQNATKHGCCSESILIMKGENPADLKALETTWFKAYNPKDAAETEMVNKVVESKWYERRCLRKLAEMETGLMKESDSPFDWTEEQQKALARFQRYATARTNAVIKAIKALEDYRKNRTNEVQKTEKHEIVKQTARRKAEDEMTVEECIKEMEEIAALRDLAKNL